jgi:hypothetical protein
MRPSGEPGSYSRHCAISKQFDSLIIRLKPRPTRSVRNLWLAEQGDRSDRRANRKERVPILIIQGGDDQVVPIGALLSSRLVKNARLEILVD